MKVFKLHETAVLPAFATEGSAAFDLRVHLLPGNAVVAYTPHNKKLEIPVKLDNSGTPKIQVHPQFRVLVPTGLIFNIPKNRVLKVFIRSSMALKYGLNLANNTAIIDSDYVDETYVMLYNMSDTPINLLNGDRIAQAILENVENYTLTETKTRPTQKTDREGGLGSTGVS